MTISASAILTNHFGQVLLTQDSSGQALITPSTPLEVGRLPTDSLAQAIRDTIGVIALPVRLTGIYAGSDGLKLAFRAIQRGGAIADQGGQPAAGFFDAIPTPEPMLPAQRQMVEDAIHHAGGPPICAPTPTSLSGLLQRVLAPSGPSSDAVVWEARATLILQDEAGAVLWRRAPKQSTVELPTTAVGTGDLPCKKAAALAQALGSGTADPQLSAVYLHPSLPFIDFIYAGAGRALTSPSIYYLPGSEPADCLPTHVQYIAESMHPDETITFRLLPLTGSSIN